MVFWKRFEISSYSIQSCCRHRNTRLDWENLRLTLRSEVMDYTNHRSTDPPINYHSTRQSASVLQLAPFFSSGWRAWPGFRSDMSGATITPRYRYTHRIIQSRWNAVSKSLVGKHGHGDGGTRYKVRSPRSMMMHTWIGGIRPLLPLRYHYSQRLKNLPVVSVKGYGKKQG